MHQGMLSSGVIARNLKQDADNVWRTGKQSFVSYPEDGNAACLMVEEQSFWFHHRNECILALLQNYPPGGIFLDVGGGNGFVTRALLDAGYDAVLLEPCEPGAQNAQNRGVERIICAALQDVEFTPGAISAAGIFDVLEHIEDETGFLNILHEIMMPGGLLYISVPAYQELWSSDDVVAQHFRRYTLPGLVRTLRLADFEPVYQTYMFQWLPLPTLLLRTLPTRLGIRNVNAVSRDNNNVTHLSGDSLIHKVFNRILKVELRKIKARETIPFGGSCLIAARAKARN